jgi:checkpoint serine/threonine-protein kinase
MAESDDLIDFSTIETQKENIQSLPGGRSAKQLSLLCSPVANAKPAPLSQTQELKNRIRADFEEELRGIDDADDPLDVYDRYVKWSLDAYPSAQATRESGLPRLLERATGAFLASATYRNDPRYLKLWLLYVRLFAADAPGETYAFLARHGVGDALALFYEEYAAWLEGAGRWRQADEVLASGVQREARPAERLLRKYAEFQKRRDAHREAGGDSMGPDDGGAAMPVRRPALAQRAVPSEGAAADPQASAQSAAAAAAAAAKPRGGKKLAVFADGDAPAAEGAPSSQGWDTIGSLAERKKENHREPRPWAGETLDGGRKAGVGEPKMAVFRDPVSLPSFPCPFPKILRFQD